MSIDLYDLLDVPRDASPEAVRAAWKAAVADLDPTDRSFRAYNQAAEVLLDPERRAAYDATLAPVDAPAEADVLEHDEFAAAALADQPTTDEDVLSRDEPEAEPEAEPATQGASGARWTPPGWLLIGLALMTVAFAAAATYLWVSDGSSDEDTEAADAAQVAAERAVVPVLSYDYRKLDETHDAAVAHLTKDYREKYEQLFAVIEQNAPGTQTVVTAKVVGSALARTGEDRAEILLFVDRPTTNKTSTEPTTYRDQVTVTMERVGDDWLIDAMRTTPGSP